MSRISINYTWAYAVQHSTYTLVYKSTMHLMVVTAYGLTVDPKIYFYVMTIINILECLTLHILLFETAKLNARYL